MCLLKIHVWWKVDIANLGNLNTLHKKNVLLWISYLFYEENNLLSKKKNRQSKSRTLNIQPFFGNSYKSSNIFSLKKILEQMVCSLSLDVTSLPNKGICSEVMGIDSDTVCWNTVSDSRTVTPKIASKVSFNMIVLKI